jgi:hypothetical protein
MADNEDPPIMADPPLMVTAGALGNEDKGGSRHRKGKKSKKKTKSEGKHSKSKRARSGSKLVAPPIFSTAPLTPKENLAGRVDHYIRDVLGVKRREIKTAKPYHQVNFTSEPTITFEIRSNKNEFIRFAPDSLSLVYYANYLNPARNQAPGQPDEVRAERHTLRANQNLPYMFLDPSVMGTGFFHRVEVLVDNVPCTTNADLGNLMIPYTRCSRIYCEKPPGPYFATSSDFNAAADPISPALKLGMEPFSASAWNSTEGYRMPVFLDGHFPFDLKNRTLESIDRRQEPHLYFPPDTCISIKLHAHRTKMESIFHPEIAPNMEDYWNRDANVNNYDALGFRFTFLDALMCYESVQLHPAHHVDLMQAYRAGGLAQYDYDRVCGQYCPLLPNLTITENRFQIDPFARLIYILFLPDYATFNIDALRRPLSGFSRFPEHNTSMTVSFASEENLIHERLENFGIRGRRVEASKHIYWQKLRDTRITSAAFEQLFPKSRDDYSVIQTLVMDLRNNSSRKVESLVLRMEFAGANRSPAHQQVVVLSVHPTGQLQCSLDNNTGRWIWNFATRTYDGI